MLLSLRVAVEVILPTCAATAVASVNMCHSPLFKAIYKKSYPAWFSLKDDVDQTTCGDLTMLYINDVR
jgi:hypothetical protein